MMEAAAQRPKIYKDHEELEEQPFSLIELMSGVEGHPNSSVRNGSCYVRGIQLVISPNGETRPQGTDFFAFRYTIDANHPILAPGAVVNKYWSAVMLYNLKRAILLPSRNHAGRFYSLLNNAPSYEVKLGLSGHWLYTGGLVETLQELDGKGWAFDLAKHPSSREEFLQRMAQRGQRPELNFPEGLIIDENLSLEKALAITSQKP
ncbi:hypothetical protein A3A14_01840 [Candidatus Daviesbacteria bacterium RIFCSPLOWO2_01_FULL_43_38]|uniref:Uncharacterized protein n=2 Tax=Candidatus Daviesiibacteriota TaxID=1752718 RepID=A0A1F5K537_9BACT|nr:MAG: hypothetical protein UV41_C0023G0003 [Candidatus Daviesbacteria bacterium GW2011_GWA2_42_7]OGE20179.1 MAG: hypothetical protein A2874_03350 [Candidatus Daviesbacteria bacterium RIFCSPHIGHO2_01_FULL_43_17]OGE36056.1 MAG: hypothetical protein A3E45_03935 [Candidatus Daviesbacteria bacterium RIFCSPHIGHO2_12_FULL_43_11]OGE63982.1 MAG: hypothetical protein A3A14_01840 [Candidatus Daviesbacteria bacterium RIFCSPLOWO2_01_FULL_43_38]OGE69250.1 MAG: hypothetical protein A3J21_02940 [Candidatus D